MTKERLKEIKDSIDFQEMVINNDKELQKARILFDEEKELYDEVIRLQEELKVAKDNEETYRLEMQEITKILNLDEHTIFDEVKEYARKLQEELETEKDEREYYQAIVESWE